MVCLGRIERNKNPQCLCRLCAERSASVHKELSNNSNGNSRRSIFTILRMEVSAESKNFITRSTSHSSKTAGLFGEVPAHRSGSKHCMQDRKRYCSFGSDDVRRCRI